MTKQEWLEKVNINKDKLISLLGNYYPSAGCQGHRHNLDITAPGAEAACEQIRKNIAIKESEDPIKRFTVALAIGDIGEINSLLNSAWFGVPESTSCWQINGFKEAVDLMEDIPEEE